MVDILPDIILEFSPTTKPAAVPSWVDISSYLQADGGWNCKRGRDSEWDRVAAGTGSVALKNQDRTFDPTCTTGPYYGNLKRLRRMRMRARWPRTTGFVYDLFGMYVERWPQNWEGAGTISKATVPLVDGFAVLALAKLNKAYGEALSGARINEVLDDINWGSGQAWVLDSATLSILGSTTILGPVGDREVEEGNSTMQAETLADVYALNHLLDVGDNEQGRLFMGKNGALVFQGRHRAYKAPYNASQGTFGDGPGELPYADLELDDDTPLYNDVRLTRVGGTEQTASDATSQDDYFPRTFQKSDLKVTTDAEVADRANWTLNRAKQPGTRIKSITIKPTRDPDTLWPIVLGAEIGDRYTVVRRPPGGGNVISQESFIEGIQHRMQGDEWVVQWWLSPADTSIYWLLDDAIASVLGSTTRLGY